MRLTFLGTGGGRYVTYKQIRRTGGMWISAGVNVLVDPGPGSVRAMREKELNPEKLDIILATHAHIDHVTDLPVAIEGMARGGKDRRGIVVGPRSVISGDDEFTGLSKYLRGLPREVFEVKPGDTLEWEELKIKVGPATHTEPYTVSYRLELPGASISILGDTGYDPNISRVHRGVDILVLNLETPKDIENKFTCPEIARRFVEEIDPGLVVLTHFGLVITVRHMEEKIAKELSEATGKKVIAARDLMDLEYGSLFSFGER